MDDPAYYRSIMKKLREGRDLGVEEATLLARGILAQEFSEIQTAGLLVALSAKGESVNEIVGFVRGLRDYAVKLNHPHRKLVDTAGTGGDGLGTFNVSTGAAFIIAGAGVAVAKHGNHGVSSRCGSADVLDYLGVNIHATRQTLEKCLSEIGIAFLFAPAFHPALKIVQKVRKELGIRTIFNLLGPVLNPAGALRQVVGVYSPHLTELLGEALRQLGSEHVLVFAGEDGLDEISLGSCTRVTELKEGALRTKTFSPESFGFPRYATQEFAGGNVAENAAILHDLLALKRTGAQRDILLLNAAAGIYVGGIAASIGDGIALARESLESKAALKKLKALIAYTNNETVEHRGGKAPGRDSRV